MSVTEKDTAAVIAYLQDQRALMAVQDTMPQSWAYQINATAPRVDGRALQAAAVKCAAARKGGNSRRDIEVAELVRVANGIVDRRSGMTRSQIIQHVPRELGGDPARENEWLNSVARMLDAGVALEVAREATNRDLGIVEAKRELVPPPADLRAAIRHRPAPLAPEQGSTPPTPYPTNF